MSQEHTIKIRELFLLLSRHDKEIVSPSTTRIKLHGLDFVLVNEPRDVLSIYYRTTTMSDWFIFRVSVVGGAFCVSERKSPAPVEGLSWNAAKHYFITMINNVIGQ